MTGLRCALILLAGFLSTGAVDLPPRSVSTSRQFIVFSHDTALRARVAGFAEQNKGKLLSLLGTTDEWQAPIVINLAKGDPSSPDAPPSDVRLFNTGNGMKIQIDVRLDSDPAAVALQPRIIEALLLEYAYRGRTPEAGKSYERPPAWLVEGIAERIRRQMMNSDADVFEALMAGNQLPAIGVFLESSPGDPGSAWREVFRAGSCALVDLLTELPKGNQSLADLVKDLGTQNGGPAEERLLKHFPSLGDTIASLEKWWTLSIARYAASERYRGDTAFETDRRLEELLQITIPSGSGEGTETHPISEYRKFIKRDGAREAMSRRVRDFADLSARGNVLFRAVIAEYQDIATRLARGKTRGIEPRLEAAGSYRQAVLERIDGIADFLNWLEATQVKTRSGEFESYLQAADRLEGWKQRRTDPITRYVDILERELNRES